MTSIQAILDWNEITKPRTRRRINLKILAVLLTVLSVATSSYYAGHVLASSSGQNWFNEGGGFCSSTFDVFNSTVGTAPGIYGENCQTGQNQAFNATDVSFLVNSLISNFMPFGGRIHLRAGLYNEMTPMILSDPNVCFSVGSATPGTVCGGIILQGDGPGGLIIQPTAAPGYTMPKNQTLLIAKATLTDMIENAPNPTYSSTRPPASTTVIGDNIKDLALDANGKATNGINFAMGEAGAVATLIDNVKLTAVPGLQTTSCPGGFTGAGIILDGNEDSKLSHIWASADTITSHCADAVDIQWRNANGDVNISDSLLNGAVSVLSCAQTIVVRDSTFTTFKFATTGCPVSNGTAVLMALFVGNYMAVSVAGTTGQTSRINLNGMTSFGQIALVGDWIVLNSAGVANMIQGPGTLRLLSFDGCTFHNISGTWTTGSPTITETKSAGTNLLQDGDSAPTGFPFTADANGVF